MLKTPQELLAELGASIRTRRVAMRWSQAEAAARAGMSERTWRRLEVGGQASIENLVNAALALRCEEGLANLFPAPAAASMDELLKRQTAAAPPARRRSPRRAARSKSKPS
jgi:transcriptional regulator with XRE-family HTH domain